MVHVRFIILATQSRQADTCHVYRSLFLSLSLYIYIYIYIFSLSRDGKNVLQGGVRLWDILRP
jgi:hypothetical protein